MVASDSEKSKETFGADGDGRDGGGVLGAGGVQKAVSCSICLEIVVMDGDRSTAKLQCGHEFHLDCIGSAFNVKGVMQCPNCRKVEKGNWLYANGCRVPPEISMDDWAPNDLYDIAYPEVPFALHWCPFGRLTPVLSFYEEGESSPSLAFQDFFGQRAVFADQVTFSTATNSSQWNHVVMADGPTVQAVHPMGFQYNHLAHYSRPPHGREGNRGAVADQSAVPLRVPRSGGRLDPDMPLRATNPGYHFSYFHGNAGQLQGDSPGYHFSYFSGNGASHPRNVGSIPLPFVPAALMQGQGNISEHYLQTPPSIFAGSQGRRTSRVLGSVSPLQPDGPFLPPSLATSTSLEAEDNISGTQFYAWERDRLAPYPLMPAEFGTSWWGSSQSHGATPVSTAESDHRRSFWRHVSEFERPAPQTRSDTSDIPHMHSFM